MNEQAVSVGDESSSPKGLFKVILLGSNGVGKTSLFFLIKDNEYCDVNHTSRHPVPNYCGKSITYKDETIKMTLYDPEHGMNYHNRSLTRSYYTGSIVALLVYSADNIDSINCLGDLVKDIKDNAGQAKLFLIRNKTDLNDPTVTKEEALSKLRERGYDTSIAMTLDTSAVTGEGIENLKKKIGKALLEAEAPERKSSFKVYLPKSPSSSPKKRKCC